MVVNNKTTTGGQKMKKKMTCIVCLLVIVVVLVSLGIYFKPRKAEELSEEEHLSVLSKKSNTII